MSTSGHTVRWLLRLVICLSLTAPAAARIIYVDDDAHGANNGSSWQDAYRCLQNALEIAKNGDEIRVAQGIYRPDQRTAGTSRGRLGIKVEASADRKATFRLISGVTLKGGYAGLGEHSPDVRDVDAYGTILSGDLAGDDKAVADCRELSYEPTRAENSYQIVTADGVNSTAILDGFTISAGNASVPDWRDVRSSGGGMYAEDGKATVMHCTFKGNRAAVNGGAIAVFGGRPSLLNCVFTSNSADWGGGIYSQRSAPTIVSCTFRGNHADRGAGVYNIKTETQYGQPRLTDCAFIGNRADRTGGAIYNAQGSATLTNCIFMGNSTLGFGGTMDNTRDSAIRLTNCTVAGNWAYGGGGGIACTGGASTTLVNTILWESSSYVIGGFITATYSNIQGGWPGAGNIDVNPLLTPDGHLRAASPCVDAGDPSFDSDPSVPRDIDGENRVVTARVDMGADDFIDTDGDRLPDWWEKMYFGDAKVADPSEDPDDDGLANLDEYESYSSDPTAAPLYVEPFAASVRLLQEGTRASRDGDIALPPPAIAMNLAGYPRPMGTAVDMGNYERQDRPPPALPGPRAIYVDTRANGADDGSSWQDAYRFLQDALADANDLEKPVEIYVAQGTYTPDRGDGYFRGDKQAKFLLKSGTTLRGGFAGMKADDPNAWDWRAYKTVLSGDLDSNDERRLDNFTENSDHVIWCIEADATAVLDGFTITGGYATDRIGGGLFNYGASPTVKRCVFFDNYASQGGGMANRHSSPTVTACTFTGNYAPLGGGGMYNTDQSHPIVRSCVFHDNRTRYLGGGGMYSGDSNPTVTDCFFVRNGAPFGGGMYNVAAEPVISNCTFSSNRVPSWGAGMQNEGGARPIVTNCILWGNSPDQIRTFTGSSGTVVVTYSDVQGGHPGQGNTNVDPLLTPDGHLRAGSPCINAGDPSVTSDPGVRRDMDDESRVLAARVDMGADEFIDSDGDGLPDWWEQTYFGGVRAADPGDDPDGDGLANLDEYALYSSAPTAAPIRVDPLRGPFPTIQAAINVAQDGDTVLVAPGTYRGSNNRDLDFRGKSVVLRAVEGPEATVIDCQGKGRGFHFHWGETAGAAVIGVTIANGRAEQGSAIRCEASSPQFRNCVITDNSDPNDRGAALYAHLTMLTLADCQVTKNYPRGVSIHSGSVQILGTVNIASNNWTGRNLMLYGEGTLRTQSDVTLDLHDCRIRCNISGPGVIRVPLDSQLIVEAEAFLDLGHETEPHGLIVCDGLLRVKDDAVVSNAQVHVTRASFEGDAIIANCVFEAEAGAPYGQFFIEDNVQLWLESIKADGDRYLDLDPRVFDCNNVHVDAIEVNVTEGVGGTYGGLFELRGRDLAVPPCGPDQFLCPVERVPDFGPDTWTLDRLELVEGAKLNLTNRFDFQSPYDLGGEHEVLYVRELVLGPNSLLNTAYNRLYCETLTMDPTAEVVNVPLLGFSLNNIAFDDENDFRTRVAHNNHIDEDQRPPDTTRIHVERVVGHTLDPNGVMRMCNLRDIDPDSPTRGQTIAARAQGLFARSSEKEILIRFEYEFETSDPDAQLLVYLTDLPELLGHDDAARADHYIQVARVPNPPVGRPGSAGSGRFATFEQITSVGHLDFVRGTRVEFELIGPEGTCILIDNWDPLVLCYGICLDVTGDNFVSVIDFLTVIGEYGSTAELHPDPRHSRACLEGAFSEDGFVDLYDVIAWDWTLSAEGRKNLCYGLPLSDVVASASGPGRTFDAGGGLRLAASTAGPLEDLLILGKRNAVDAAGKLEDRLYAFDRDGQYARWLAPSSSRCNVKLVQGANGELYQINSEAGVVKLDGTNEVAIPPGRTTYAREPRHNSSATVYIGIQGQEADCVGRPVLDAAFDQEHAYVVPVVVNPEGMPSYAAAAKLKLLRGANPPYEVIQLFDDPPPPGDNQDPNNLREIEVDGHGRVYVLNAHHLNEGDILWRYYPDGTSDRLDLRRLENGMKISDPIAMYISETTGMLYLASAQSDPVDANVTFVHGFSAGASLMRERSVAVEGMQHLTGIAEDPTTSSLWVVGFNMVDIPEYPGSSEPPFYHPCFAVIPPGSGTVQAAPLSGFHDLALPMSVVWTETGTDMSDFFDFAYSSGPGPESDRELPTIPPKSRYKCAAATAAKALGRVATK